jgi:hypothetical protein
MGASYPNLGSIVSGPNMRTPETQKTQKSFQDAAVPFLVEQDQWIGNINGENLFNDPEDNW